MTVGGSRYVPCDRGVAMARGSFTEAERRAHEAHVSSCDDCRMLARLHADVTVLGDLRRGDEKVVASAVEGTLARLDRTRSAAGGRRRAMPGLLVVVLVAGSSAGAFAARRQLAWLASATGEVLFARRRTPPDRAAAEAAVRAKRGIRVAAAGTEPIPARFPEPAPGPAAPPVQSIPQRKAALAGSPRPSSWQRSEARPIALPAEAPAGTSPGTGSAPDIEGPRHSLGSLSSPASPESRSSPASRPFLLPVPGARQLLADGTAARARGERAVAVGIFGRLQSRYPTSPEALVSLISSGQLLLDQGDFAGALAAFGAYRERSPAGSLAEEALDGLARSFAGLARFDEERRTWRELMARFPRSAYLPRARARLQLSQ